jgi:hypothetical protein
VLVHHIYISVAASTSPGSPAGEPGQFLGQYRGAADPAHYVLPNVTTLLC